MLCAGCGAAIDTLPHISWVEVRRDTETASYHKFCFERILKTIAAIKKSGGYWIKETYNVSD